MATTITDEVLALFRDEIPCYQDDHGKEIPLELDSDLFDYPRDDLEDAIRKYKERFGINPIIWTGLCTFHGSLHHCFNDGSSSSGKR